ncbi:MULTISPECIES: hypothetical protein [Marinobacter]|jgi:hypothetical protein|uniref:hypothetical protein n=1 Tax=Marinobacter TaxID=2742 RepID=UPI001108FB0C|nr:MULTISPECIES: hypothetical protein [Marinobacter]MCK2151250.1 hypothetical protein [Marinobacter alexandrii]
MLAFKKHHQFAPQQPFTVWMESYSRRQKFRRMARSLLAERDEILSDLGYDRYDLLDALHLPLHNDAMQYIEARRSKRKQQNRAD